MNKTYNELSEYLGSLQAKASEDETYLIIKTGIAETVSKVIDGVSIIKRRLKEDLDIVTVPWTFENATKLSDLNVASISTILKKGEYDFSGKLKPFSHQYSIASFLSTNKRAFCLSDMGTGKTLAISHAFNYLLQKGIIKKVLVVCPLSVMRDAWAYTIPLVNGDVKAEIIYDRVRYKRLNKLNQDNISVHIINPDGIKVASRELIDQEYDLIVIDELTYYKTETTIRWKFLNNLTIRAKYVWGITGTPVPNSPLDAYGQIKIVSPNNLDKISFKVFKEYINRDTLLKQLYSLDSDNMSDKDILDIVYKYFNPAIRVKKEDCLDLPDVVNVYRYCELSTEQLKFYKQMRDEGNIRLRDGTYISTQNGASNVIKMLQIACGSVYNDLHDPIHLDNQNRIKESIEIIREARLERQEDHKGKVLVFIPFRASLDKVYNELSKHFKVAKINSDVNERQRTEILDKFQNTSEIEVIIAIPTTMSHGITATSASVIIWFSPIYSCETYLQACNRINRAGQTQKMTIFHLYGSDIETKIYRALQDKELTQATLLSYYKEFINGN